MSAAMKVSGCRSWNLYFVLAFHTSSVKHVGSVTKSPRCFRNCLLEIVELSWVGFIKGLFPLIVPNDS